MFAQVKPLQMLELWINIKSESHKQKTIITKRYTVIHNVVLYNSVALHGNQLSFMSNKIWNLTIKLECRVHLNTSQCIANTTNLNNKSTPFWYYLHNFQALKYHPLWNEQLIQCHLYFLWKVFLICFVTKEISINIVKELYNKNKLRLV